MLTWLCEMLGPASAAARRRGRRRRGAATGGGQAGAHGSCEVAARSTAPLLLRPAGCRRPTPADPLNHGLAGGLEPGWVSLLGVARFLKSGPLEDSEKRAEGAAAGWAVHRLGGVHDGRRPGASRAAQRCPAAPRRASRRAAPPCPSLPPRPPRWMFYGAAGQFVEHLSDVSSPVARALPAGRQHQPSTARGVLSRRHPPLPRAVPPWQAGGPAARRCGARGRPGAPRQAGRQRRDRLLRPRRVSPPLVLRLARALRSWLQPGAWSGCLLGAGSTGRTSPCRARPCTHQHHSRPTNTLCAPQCAAPRRGTQFWPCRRTWRGGSRTSRRRRRRARS